MDASHSHAVITFLYDGPLKAQRLTVHTTRGGKLPNMIYPHAPLPPGHLDEPGPRHAYYLGVDRQYRHLPRCPC
jgi:hypothetical protein